MTFSFMRFSEIFTETNREIYNFNLDKAMTLFCVRLFFLHLFISRFAITEKESEIVFLRLPSMCCINPK